MRAQNGRFGRKCVRPPSAASAASANNYARFSANTLKLTGVLNTKTNLSDNMSIPIQSLLIDISGLMIIFVTPLFILFWRLPKDINQISWWRFLGSIACGWLLLILHRFFIAWPYVLDSARKRGNLNVDGVGGNVVTLVAGWVPVLLVTVLYSLFALLWWKFRKRHTA